MLTKTLVAALVVALATAAQLPSTSYGTPSRGQAGGSFGGGVSTRHGGGQTGGFGGHGGAQTGGFGGHSGGQSGSFGGSQTGGFGGHSGTQTVSFGGQGGSQAGSGFSSHGGSQAGGFSGQRGSQAGGSYSGSSRGSAGGFGGVSGGGFASGGQGASRQDYRPSGPVVPILVDERDGPHADGTYSFNFETGDGITRHEQGYPKGPEGAVVSQGGWSFTFPDGTPAVFNFVADENGYRVESDLLPTPHPLPAHAIAQIEFARQQEAQGGSYGGQQGGAGGDFRGSSSGGFGGASGGFGGAQAGGAGGAHSSGFGGAASSGFRGSGGRPAPARPAPAPAQAPSRSYGYP